jgi:hypothetical protein
MRPSGRYCWSCGGRRPNERFSRRSARRGVCRDCYRAGPAELAYRQAVRNIDRALRFSELIPRRHRKMIEGFLSHQDARLRAYAADLIARDAEARRERAEWARAEEQMYDALVEMPASATDQDLSPPLEDLDGAAFEDTDIPF